MGLKSVLSHIDIQLTLFLSSASSSCCTVDCLSLPLPPGLFAYGSGCLGVVEDLSNGKQKHFEGMQQCTRALFQLERGVVWC